ncbi:MAG: DNA-processing protein DprA [Candidatus Cloacimonetes bacterium]|nr:DNA-processing protein DprA [Candidatus Cloacimonadota bacterium]
MIEYVSQDSLATILICSNIIFEDIEKDTFKPYTIPQWNKLAIKIANSNIKRPANLLNADKEHLIRELELTQEEWERLDFLLNQGAKLAIELEKLNSLGIRVSTRSESNYPKSLRQKLKAYSPPVIYYSGDIELANRDLVSIVGSRDVDDHGFHFARQLSQKIARQGFGVVSGGAKGVDSIAEFHCIDNGGYAVSFVSDTLNKKIKNKDIRNAILQDKLLLISAANPYERFYAYSAMERNKYIYALSKIAVVVATSDNKGGTWSGATENLKKGWTPVFARSDNNSPVGNQNLIKLGVYPLSDHDINKDSFSVKYLIDNSEPNNSEGYKQMDLSDL